MRVVRGVLNEDVDERVGEDEDEDEDEDDEDEDEEDDDDDILFIRLISLFFLLAF